MNDAMLVVCGFLIGCCAGLFIGQSAATNEHESYYRTILIKNGIGKWEADESGNPMFVITHKQKAND